MKRRWNLVRRAGRRDRRAGATSHEPGHGSRHDFAPVAARSGTEFLRVTGPWVHSPLRRRILTVMMDRTLLPIIPVKCPSVLEAPICLLHDLGQRFARMLAPQPVLAARFHPLGHPEFTGLLLWQDHGQRQNQLQESLTIVTIEHGVAREDRFLPFFRLILVGPLCEEVHNGSLTMEASTFWDLWSSHSLITI
jgi:hypothetical protein